MRECRYDAKTPQPVWHKASPMRSPPTSFNVTKVYNLFFPVSHVFLLLMARVPAFLFEVEESVTSRIVNGGRSVPLSSLRELSDFRRRENCAHKCPPRQEITFTRARRGRRGPSEFARRRSNRYGSNGFQTKGGLASPLEVLIQRGRTK